MKFSIDMVVLAGLGLIGSVVAAKGKAEVQACVWMSTQPSNFTVQWTVGHSGDSCMKRKGNNKAMLVSSQGLTCISLGDVEVDDDSTCYWKSSRWGMSYTVDGGKPYSGATSSRWSTGPSNSDIALKDQSPGTNVCGSKSACTSGFLEWNNDNNEPVYIVFKPGTVAGIDSELK